MHYTPYRGVLTIIILILHLSVCVRCDGRSSEVDLTSKLRMAILNAGKFDTHGDGVIERVLTTTAYSCETLGMGKIELYTCAWRPVVSKLKRTRKKV